MPPNPQLERFDLMSREELVAELSTRAADTATLLHRAHDDDRPLTPEERESIDRAEVEAVYIRGQVDAYDDEEHGRRQALGDGIKAELARLRNGGPVLTRSADRLWISDQTLKDHAKAIAEGRTLARMEEPLELFERANQTTVANVGAARQFLDPRFQTPSTLRDFAGIPEGPLEGNALQMPSVTVVGTAGVAETVDHPEQTATPANASILRYGRWSQVSALVDALGEIQALSAAHRMGIALDLTSLDANAIHTAAGTALAFITNVDQNVRRGVYEVAQATGADPSDLVLLGNAVDLALVTSVTPASGGDRGSVAARVYGARVYPAPIPTGFVTVFSPKHFRVITSRVATATTVNSANGSNTFGAWVHAAPATQFLTGAAKAIDVVTP